ncbi:MAG: Gldg family protein, partial [Clostridia bacterium]|nr:Gldg family protein [Clostridia bacterium]
TLVALSVAAVLEVVQILFFVLKRSAFEGLATRVLSLLSPVVRFDNFTGGILDIPSLVCFLLLAAVLVVLSVEQVRQQKDSYQRDVEAAEKSKASSGNKFKVTKAPKLSEQAEDEENAAAHKAADLAALKRAIPAGIACAAALIIMLGLSLTKTALIKDTTSTHMFSENERFRQVIDAVRDDVTIYWICQNGAEDATLQTALYYYSRQNPHLTVQKIEPLSNVEFLQTYIVESISNNALLLMSGERSRYLPREELYANDYSRYEQTGLPDMAFQLENMMGHGLEYVGGTSALPTIYEVTGHGETPLTDYWKVMIQKLDMAVSSCELSSIPEGANSLLLYDPQQDLSATERDKLEAYLSGGGKLFVVTSAEKEQGTLPVLKQLLSTYGIETIPGLVIEAGTHIYAEDTPYSFYPRMLVHSVNEEGAYSEKAVLFSEVQGLKLTDVDGVTTTPLLISSEESYSKVDGYQISTFSKENRDIDGPFTLAALSEKGQGTVVWVGTASLLAEDANEVAEGGNRYFIYGVLRYFGADQEWETIPRVICNYGVLMANETLVSRLGLVLAGVFPIFYLLIGGIFWALKKRNELILQAQAEEAAQQAAEEARKREEEEAERKREAFRKARREAAIKAKEERQKAKTNEK